MTQFHSNLPFFDLAGKRVLLRADLNVPLLNGKVGNDYRLKMILPTLDLIQKKGGTICIATHIGRPNKYDADLSTQVLLPWFKQHGYTIDFASDIGTAHKKSLEHTQAIIMLENLRFFPQEKNNDALFAQALASLGDYYVNDAFASMHRKDTSIYTVPQLFSDDKKTIGLLVEKELTILTQFMHNAPKPSLAFLGGGKVADKLPVIQHLLGKIDTIALCPAIVFTFLKAQGLEVGRSLTDDTKLSACDSIVQKANSGTTTLLFPIDYQVAKGSLQGLLHIESAQRMSLDAFGISIGPHSIELFSKLCVQAGSIFFNAAMGFPQRPETLVGSQQLLKAMQRSNAHCIIAGGDSVALAQSIGITNTDTIYLSTGGGATLTLLSGQPLPGLDGYLKSGS